MNKNKIHRKHYLSLKIYTKTNDQGIKDKYKDDKVFYHDIIHPNFTSKRSNGFNEKLKTQIELQIQTITKYLLKFFEKRLNYEIMFFLRFLLSIPSKKFFWKIYRF